MLRMEVDLWILRDPNNTGFLFGDALLLLESRDYYFKSGNWVAAGGAVLLGANHGTFHYSGAHSSVYDSGLLDFEGGDRYFTLAGYQPSYVTAGSKGRLVRRPRGPKPEWWTVRRGRY